MDVICLSSDSEESPFEFVRTDDFKRSPCSQRDDVEDIFNLDWDGEEHPAINYQLDLRKKSESPVVTEDEIEDFVIPCKQAKRSNDSDEDLRIHDVIIKKESEKSSERNNDSDEDLSIQDVIIKKESQKSSERNNDSDEDLSIHDVIIKKEPQKSSERHNDSDEDLSIHDVIIKKEPEPGPKTDDCDYDDDSDDNDITLVFEKINSSSTNQNHDPPEVEETEFPEVKKTDICKKSKPKLSQQEREEVIISKEQKKLERERLREEKKAEQLRQKAYKSAMSENQRNLKPEENIKFLKVHIDNEIINSVCGGNIICLLQQNSIQYVVESQIKTFTITWSKRRIIKVVDDNGDLTERIESKDEEQLLYVLDWQKAVNLIHTNDLLSHVETVKSVYNEKSLTLVIYGLGKYFSYKKSTRNNCEVGEKRAKPKPSDRVYEDAPYISKDELEIALIDLQLLGKHNCRLIETPEELSSLVLNFTKSLSQIEFKLERQKRQEGDLEWFAKGDSNQCVKVDKCGNGLMRLWQQQICQFSSVGLETAQAVVSNYNSPAALVNEYENCDSQEEGEMLLQDIKIRRNAGILSSTRRVGPQLSKKIYNFFMNDLPDCEL